MTPVELVLSKLPDAQQLWTAHASELAEHVLRLMTNRRGAYRRRRWGRRWRPNY